MNRLDLTFPNTKNSVIHIPKIIMQTWKTHELPDHWKPSPLSIKKYMPNWRYLLLDDNEIRSIVEKNFPDFLPYFDKFPWGVQRADAIRPIFLYLYGGLYLDLDFELQAPLDQLFTEDAGLYLVKSGNLGSWVTNSLMASKQGHPFWLYYIEQMKMAPPWWAVSKHFQIMTSTGPMKLTWCLQQYKANYFPLPRALVMPCSVCNISRCQIYNALLKPLPGQSWNSLDSQILNFLLCHWKQLLFFLFLFLVVIFIIYLYFKASRARQPSRIFIV